MEKSGKRDEPSRGVSVREISNGDSGTAKAAAEAGCPGRTPRNSEALLRLAGDLCASFDMERIEKLFLMTFAGRLGLRKAAIYLISPGGGEYRLGYELGSGPAPLPSAISRRSPFPCWLEKENGAVFIGRFPAGLPNPPEIDMKFLSDIGGEGFSHAFMLGGPGGRLGILFFGGKADGSPLTDSDREYASGIVRMAEIAIRNVFEHQKLAGEIRKSTEFARVRREVILGNADEIRTPLSVMKSSLCSLDPQDAGSGLLVDMAKDAMKRLESKLEQLLSVCGMEGRETSLTLEKVDAASLVEDTMREFIPELEEKRITVRMNDGTSGANVFMDPSKMEIVLRMIVENSIRAVDRGGRIEIDTLLSHEGPGEEDGVELLPWDGEVVLPGGEGAESFPGCAALDVISREMESRVENRGPFIVFRIRDDGAGIPRGEIAELSFPFRKGSNGAREWLGRPGTGLTVAQNIVSAHGGKILCESLEGSGSSFSVWLPSAF